jgi:hypothetical protein
MVLPSREASSSGGLSVVTRHKVLTHTFTGHKTQVFHRIQDTSLHTRLPWGIQGGAAVWGGGGVEISRIFAHKTSTRLRARPRPAPPKTLTARAARRLRQLRARGGGQFHEIQIRGLKFHEISRAEISQLNFIPAISTGTMDDEHIDDYSMRRSRTSLMIPNGARIRRSPVRTSTIKSSARCAIGVRSRAIDEKRLSDLQIL